MRFSAMRFSTYLFCQIGGVAWGLKFWVVGCGTNFGVALCWNPNRVGRRPGRTAEAWPPGAVGAGSDLAPVVIVIIVMAVAPVPVLLLVILV
jgi:hypothetical protein